VRPLNVFIGYDPRQPLAFHVLAHSVQRRASRPVAIIPLILSQLPIKRRGLTDFTFSRYLVPWLSDYLGLSIFLDSDELCLGDICELADSVRSSPTASVYVSKNRLKFEWASVMVFANALCRPLRPEFVNDEANSLFDFKWAAGGVGELPGDWNHLVGYDQPNPTAKLIHFTQGIPCFDETKDSEFAAEWIEECRSMKSTVSWQKIMGNSVHAAPVLERLKKRARA
jgi:hypothetical protein